MSTRPSPRKRPSREAIMRAVASSTAIETGEGIAGIEARSRNGANKLPHLSLAFKRSLKRAQG